MKSLFGSFAFAAMGGSLASLALVPVWAGAQPASEARFMARDLVEIVSPVQDSIRLSPDGERLAFVHPDMSDETNLLSRRPTGYIHIQDLARLETAQRDEASIQLGDGAAHTAFPAWSPDGRHLAYFVHEGEETQLALWDSESGATRKLASSFSGRPYLAPQWTSNGSRVVYARVIKQPESANTLFLPPPTFARAVRGRAVDDVPRVVVVDSDDKRIPGDAAFTDDRMAMLAVVDLSTGEEMPLTREALHLREFQVSSASAHAIYTIPTDESFGLVGREEMETHLVSLETGSTRRISDGGQRLGWIPGEATLFTIESGGIRQVGLSGEDEGPAFDAGDLKIRAAVWSPDGQRLAALVPDGAISDPEIEAPKSGMYSIAQPFLDLYLIARDTGEARNVTSNIPDQIQDPIWSSNGEMLFFRAIDNENFNEKLYSYDWEAGTLTVLSGGKERFDNLEYASNVVSFTAERATHPPDIYVVNTDTGERDRVVALNPQLSKFDFSEPQLFHFRNADGERLGALLYRPVALPPDEPVPVITYVYEKLTPGIHRFTASHQVFLNQGFAVLMPNVKVKVGETGTSFVKSVVPAAERVRAMGFTNGKFGIYGGSFGAYATSYIITQTDLFACAAARATPPDLFGNWASGRDRDSQNIMRGQARMGGSPYEVMRRYLAQSAFFHLDKVETPILIMHGAQDRTILFDEGEMIFYALRQLGKKAKLIAYTYGDHSLYRHSRVDAVDVHKRLLNWFGGCLK